jgi:hypothetical protein
MMKNKQKRGAPICAARAGTDGGAPVAAQTGVEKYHCESCGKVYDSPVHQIDFDGQAVAMCVDCCVPLDLYTGIAKVTDAERAATATMPDGWTTRAMQCAGARQLSMETVLMPIGGLFA